MSTLYKKVILVVMAMFTVLALTACDLFGEKEDFDKIANEVLDSIVIENPLAIRENINLPESVENDDKTYAISWKSSDTLLVSNKGVVTRPGIYKEVNLTATVNVGEKDYDKKFELVVVKVDNPLEEAYKNLSLETKTVTENITLPESFVHDNETYNLSWTSNKEATINNDGVFNQPVKDEIVTLTATISNGTDELTKDFDVVAQSSKANPGYMSDLIFSEYVEGTGYDKAIELYNGTGMPVDLSKYKILFYINDEAEAEELVLTGLLAHNETVVFIYDDSRSTLENAGVAVNLSKATHTQKVKASFNGDDEIELVKTVDNDDVVIDAIGAKEDQGNQNNNWGKDITLVRNSNIVNPNPNFSMNEWTNKGENYFDDLGVVTFDNINTNAGPDVIAPEISINKNATLQFDSNEAPTNLEQYFTVYDNVDEEMTVTADNVSLDKSFEKWWTGTYFLTITISDEAGNIGILTIELIAKLPNQYVLPQSVVDYYKSATGLTGDALKAKLNEIIGGHKEFPYTSNDTDIWDILAHADEDPNNPDNVIGVYTGLSIPKKCMDDNSVPEDCEERWQREHIWSQSHGEFGREENAGTDAHHLYAVQGSMNGAKSNRFFDSCSEEGTTGKVDKGYGNYLCDNNYFEPRDEVKGDVARILFYMVVRYEGITEDFDLELLNEADLQALIDEELGQTDASGKNSKLPYYGDLETLLKWHREDPVSDAERKRNDIIFGYQGNRNPFVDYPEFVQEIWS